MSQHISPSQGKQYARIEIDRLKQSILFQLMRLKLDNQTAIIKKISEQSNQWSHDDVIALTEKSELISETLTQVTTMIEDVFTDYLNESQPKTK